MNLIWSEWSKGCEAQGKLNTYKIKPYGVRTFQLTVNCDEKCQGSRILCQTVAQDIENKGE